MTEADNPLNGINELHDQGPMRRLHILVPERPRMRFALIAIAALLAGVGWAAAVVATLVTGRALPAHFRAAPRRASAMLDACLDHDDVAASAASAARRFSRSCSRLLAASAAAASNAARASS